MKEFRTITGTSVENTTKQVEKLLALPDGWRQINPSRSFEQQPSPETGQVDYLAYMIRE